MNSNNSLSQFQLKDLYGLEPFSIVETPIGEGKIQGLDDKYQLYILMNNGEMITINTSHYYSDVGNMNLNTIKVKDSIKKQKIENSEKEEVFEISSIDMIRIKTIDSEKGFLVHRGMLQDFCPIMKKRILEDKQKIFKIECKNETLRTYLECMYNRDINGDVPSYEEYEIVSSFFGMDFISMKILCGIKNLLESVDQNMNHKIRKAIEIIFENLSDVDFEIMGKCPLLNHNNIKEIILEFLPCSRLIFYLIFQNESKEETKEFQEKLFNNVNDNKCFKSIITHMKSGKLSPPSWFMKKMITHLKF